MSKAILITGGTGFLGRALTSKLLRLGHSVCILSRDAKKVSTLFGDKVTAVTDLQQINADDFKAVINLAGAGIFDRFWTPERKTLLRDSRIELTQHLVDWMAQATQPPTVLINGSAIGIYGNQGDSVLSENSTFVPDFSQQLCTDWEQTARQAEALGVRVCLIRTGLVLGEGGGLLKRMLLPFKLGLGGRLGSGQQWMSWIHIDDWVAIVDTLINREDLQGAFNASAPQPVTNAEFSQTLAEVLHRPMLLPLPAWLLNKLLGEMAELLLGSQRVMPERLLSNGYTFQYENLQFALNQILHNRY
jgi:uncharacterized protein (TIGR01777 family)